MDEKQIIANHRAGLLQLGIVVTCLEDFASQIIRHVINGGKLDDAAFVNIKSMCVRNLKNSQASGVPIEQETESFGKAIDNLEQLMNSAISKARGPQ